MVVIGLEINVSVNKVVKKHLSGFALMELLSMWHNQRILSNVIPVF